MELKDTIELMCSDDYKERFVAEYRQLKIRYEKLKNFCNKIEAYESLNWRDEKKDTTVKEPKHDCPFELLRTQQRQMGELLHTLEVRAVIENINLDEQYRGNK